jgi:hypothetical protein
MVRPHAFKTLALASTNETVYKGGLACLDRSTGLVKKATVDTDLIPIGLYLENVTVTGNAAVEIELFEVHYGVWMANATAGDAVVAANVGNLAYLLDDQTVANNDATNTRSVAGVIWKLDSARGVLVEFVKTPSHKLTSLDA